MVEVVETGIVYRNPRPELRSIAYLASDDRPVRRRRAVVHVRPRGRRRRARLPDVGLSVDRRRGDLVGARAGDGRSARPADDAHEFRIREMSNGEVVGFGGLMYRDDPEKSVVNVPTLGYTEMKLFLVRSRGSGALLVGPRMDRSAARGTGVRDVPLAGRGA